MDIEDINKQLKEADPVKLEQFMRMFDRILLYNIAVNALPKEAVDFSVNMWDLIIRKTLDEESKQRTEILESTIEGRKAKMLDTPDGEEIRLSGIKQLKIAKALIKANLGIE